MSQKNKTSNPAQASNSSQNDTLRQIFNKYDENGDGLLDAYEVKKIIDSQIEMSDQLDIDIQVTTNSNSSNNKPLRRDSTISITSCSSTNSTTIPSPSIDDILEMFRNANIQNNVVTFDQFLTILNTVNEEDRKIRQQFDFFDTDRSGKISKKELKKGLKKLKSDYRKKVVKNMINEADQDGDGEIDFEEFKSILCS